MYNLIDDLSELTTIQKTSLQALCDKAEMCISHSASFLGEGDVASIDIGIGDLHIGYVDGVIKYKFIPSASLENSVMQALQGNSTLIQTCEQTLVNKITNTYKTLF